MMKRRWKTCLAWMLAMLALPLGVPARAEADAAIVSSLTRLGFFSETVQELSTAVGNFQIANGLTRTNALDAETLSAIEGGEAVSQTDYLQTLALQYTGAVVESGAAYTEIVQLQTALKSLGYYVGAADGVFGDGTKNAVMAFQTANGLTPTGRADGATLYRLYEGTPVEWEAFLASQASRRGDSGKQVRSLQRRLRTMGYFDGECTATYGERTERAVAEFQRRNALAETGEADPDTCRALYSGTAMAPNADAVLSLGETGEQVRALQLALNQLGYYTGAVSGTYDEALSVAATFFQIANGLEPTGEADEALQTLAQSQSAVAFADAGEALSKTTKGVTAESLERVVESARKMLGKAFADDEAALFSGFAFVQYVYATAGIAISDPGQFLDGATNALAAGEALTPGALIALERAHEGGVTISFAVAADAQTLIYTIAGEEWVVSGDISQMEYDMAYAWNFQAE